MKLNFYFLAFLLIITSCSTSENEVLDEVSETIVVNPDKISSQFPILLQTSEENDPNCYFEYNSQGQVTKKIGGIVQMSSAAGIPNFFSNWIYTTVTYSGNSAEMNTYSSNSTFNPQVNKKYFEFDSQKRLIKSIIYAPSSIEWEKHLSYKYDATGKLVEILTELPNMPYFPDDPGDYILTYVDKFTYDVSGNLLTATTTERHDNVDAYVMKKVEFSNFDTVSNPFQSLRIFEDYFYLSLSKNNFQKIKTQEFNFVGQETSFNEMTWTNTYTPDGKLKLYY